MKINGGQFGGCIKSAKFYRREPQSNYAENYWVLKNITITQRCSAPSLRSSAVKPLLLQSLKLTYFESY